MSKILGVFLLVGVSATVGMPGTIASAATCVPVESSSGTDVVLTFNNTTNCDWVVPFGVTRIRVLLIGGGGGGGFDIGGGGGGGGFREVSNVVTTPGEVVTVTSGSGGNGDESRGTPCVGANGTSSSIVLSSGTLTAIGGGGGGGQDGGGSCATDGVTGGSGGGGGVGIQWPRVGGAGSYSTDGDVTTFGNAGGNASPSSYYAGGGGGGADSVGGAGSSNGSGAVGGAGGTGKVSNITGANTAYAGGGAGGFFQSGTRGLGGTGGGGAGGTNAVAPSVGTNGLGGGGGGGGVQNGVYGQGARGGNGVVIVRYALADVRAPVRGSSTIAAGGTQITIAFDETLSSTSANLSSFTVRADGIALGLSSVSVSGSNVVLGVSSAIWQGAVVTVSYVDPTSGDDAAAIQDTAGNDVVSFSSVSVTNSSTVTTTTTTTTTAAPVLEIVVSAPTSSTLPVGQAEIPIVSTPVVVQSTIAKSSPIDVGKTAASSTTTTVATMGTVARPAPKISAVAAGEADVKIGDKVETATVQRIQNQLVVSAGALKATLGGLNSDGSSTALDDDGNVRLKSGDVIRIKLAGFKPGSVVEAWLFSTPALLGTAKVGVDGTVTGTFTIPKNASEGSHRIAVVAKTTDGKPATLTIGVMVGEWNSGSRIAVWLIVLPIALAIGFGLILPTRLRRRRIAKASLS
jgi:hypothetical protein